MLWGKNRVTAEIISYVTFFLINFHVFSLSQWNLSRTGDNRVAAALPVAAVARGMPLCIVLGKITSHQA